MSQTGVPDPMAHTAIDPYNATEPLVWASTNPYVASVDQQGVVHAKAPGTTTINVFPLNNPSAVQRVNVVVKGGDNVSVTPEEQELTLAAGERSNAIPVEAIFNPQAKVDKLDVVFAFDTTGSMGGAIDTAKENAIDIMNLVRSRISDAQFGVISFEDYAGYMSPDSGYGDTYGGENDDPYILNQIVTDNPTLVQNAINQLYADDGYDWPESYTRALYELSDPTPRVDYVRWRTDAKKIAPEPYATWIETDPKELRNVEMPTDEPITNNFTLYVKPPEGTAAGDYQFKAVVNADGVELGTILSKIKVGEAIIARPTPNITTSVVPKGAKNKLTAQEGDVIHFTPPNGKLDVLRIDIKSEDSLINLPAKWPYCSGKVYLIYHFSILQISTNPGWVE